MGGHNIILYFLGKIICKRDIMRQTKLHYRFIMSGLNYSEVCTTIGCTRRQAERYVQQGKLTPKYEKVPGQRGKPRAVFLQSEVEELRKELRTALYKPKILEENSIVKATESEGQLLGQIPLEAIERYYQVSSLRMKLTLALDEAGIVSGLPKKTVLQLAKDGKISALKTGLGWRISARSLEEYCQNFVGCEVKAL